jgi:hypothetical protein
MKKKIIFYGRHDTMEINGHYLLDTLKKTIEIDSLVPVAQILADSCINYFQAA